MSFCTVRVCSRFPGNGFYSRGFVSPKRWVFFSYQAQLECLKEALSSINSKEMDALQSAANHTLQAELRDQNNVINWLGFKASGSPWNAEHNTNELAIDACGPVSNNARGIAEMAGMSHRFYETTEALDAAGNTNAVIGKFGCRFVGCGVILEFCSANAVYLVHSFLPLSFITPFTAIVGDITPCDGIPKHEKKTTRARSTAACVNYLVEGHKISIEVEYDFSVFELKEYYTGRSLELEISIVTGLSIL